MVLPVAAAGVITVGSRVAIPAARGIARLLSTRLTLGGAAAVTAAPVVLATADNLTGNALSETLLETPLGAPLEAYLTSREWVAGQQASVVSNAMELGLVNSGALEEGLPNHNSQIRLVDAMSHYVIGDMVGAASLASDLGLELSDIADAYNDANNAHPNATMGEIGTVMFEDLSARVQDREMGIAPVPEGRPALDSDFATSSAELSGEALDEAYDQVSFFEAGLMGAAFSGLIGFIESVNFGGWADGIVDRLQRVVVDSAQDAVVSQGNLGVIPDLLDFSPYPDGPEHDRDLALG